MTEEGSTIHLSVYQSEGDLFVRVRDSGPGIPPEKISAITERIYAPANYSGKEGRASFEKGRKGFALRNVHQRLHLLYGTPYGLIIDTNEPSGCSFTLRLPFQVEDVKL
jgi:two-component system sensor histidine kinase YesM